MARYPFVGKVGTVEDDYIPGSLLKFWYTVSFILVADPYLADKHGDGIGRGLPFIQ